MRHRLRVATVLFLFSFAALVLRADDDPAPARANIGDRILERYLANVSEQRLGVRDVSMEVDIEASLPDLKKSGELRALRRISKVGQVTYDVLSYIGDNIIKKDVIARYMTAEVKSTAKVDGESISVDASNYKFKYRGMYAQSDDWRLHLFEVKPRKKRAGLFDGWIWIEADSGLPVRQSGRFVRTPSVFLKNVDFVQDYQLVDGLAVPKRLESTIQTRLVGPAELKIEFGKPKFNGQRAQLTSEARLTGR
ncbi:MAG: hypothetical protein KIT09_00980 [Bryobacteraceae bacterium]|nr:hypothetical protein [Bryobacteraceae bacterium]